MPYSEVCRPFLGRLGVFLDGGMDTERVWFAPVEAAVLHNDAMQPWNLTKVAIRVIGNILGSSVLLRILNVCIAFGPWRICTARLWRELEFDGSHTRLEVCCTSFIKLCLSMEYFYLFLYEASESRHIQDDVSFDQRQNATLHRIRTQD